MHCFRKAFCLPASAFFWVNSFIVGNCSVPPASTLSNTIERNCDCFFFFLSKLSGLISVFLVCFFLLLCSIRKQAPPPMQLVLFSWCLWCSQHSGCTDGACLDLSGYGFQTLGQNGLSFNMQNKSRCLKFTAAVWVFVLPRQESVCRFCSRCWQNGA